MAQHLAHTEGWNWTFIRVAQTHSQTPPAPWAALYPLGCCSPFSAASAGQLAPSGNVIRGTGVQLSSRAGVPLSCTDRAYCAVRSLCRHHCPSSHSVLIPAQGHHDSMTPLGEAPAPPCCPHSQEGVCVWPHPIRLQRPQFRVSPIDHGLGRFEAT